MAHIVKCRICRQQFDTNSIDKKLWVMPNPKMYYHTSCYENWKVAKADLKTTGKDSNFWYESLVDYLYRDVKMSIDFSKLNSQWKTFNTPTRQMTPKGIYFSIRYYYDVIHGNVEKAAGGIGIVPNIYKDAAQYWTELESRRAGTLEAIISQIKEREARPVQVIKRKQTSKKDKTKWSLEEV